MKLNVPLTSFIALVTLVLLYGLISYLNDGRQSNQVARKLTKVEEAVVKDAFREIPSVRNVPETLYAPWLRVTEIKVNQNLGDCLEPFSASDTSVRSFAIRFQPYTLIGTPHSFHYVTTCRSNIVLDGLARESNQSLKEIVEKKF